jgi:hypothetical protein
MAVAKGRPADGLRLLVVAARERARLSSPGYDPAEGDRVRAAEAKARAVLGPRAAEIAADVSLETLVDSLLSDADLARP